MSRLFYAVNRETGERWKPCEYEDVNYLAIDDSGCFVEVRSSGYYETYIDPLCSKTWKVVFNKSMQSKLGKSGES